jgi:hypothetical protein
MISPTTRRDFEGETMLRITPFILLIALASIAGCQSGGSQIGPAQKSFQLSESAVQVRQLQTRRFDDVDEGTLLAACAGVLQDLGFNLDESETELGVVVASKRRDVRNRVMATMTNLLDIFVDIEIAIDKEQRIRASLVTWKDPDKERVYFVRVTFQRVVWNTDNEVSRREALNDPELYQRFFDRLSKSVFLEAHSL